MKIDHICFAFGNIGEGIDYWRDVFAYHQMTDVVINTRQKVKVVFMEQTDSVLVKLIEPLEDNAVLQRFIQRGGGFHHLCVKSDKMEEGIDELREKGLRLMVPPQPGEAFNNQPIAFMLGKYGMNVEVIDTDEKAARLPGPGDYRGEEE